MSPGPRKFRFGFQAKILLPIVALVAAVSGLTMWIVQQRSQQQFERETRQRLKTAEAVFKSSMELRARNLRSRYEIVVNDPRFRAVAQLADPPTLAGHLGALLEELEGEAQFLLFSGPEGRLLTGLPDKAEVRMEDLHRASSEGIHSALGGGTEISAVSAGGRLFNCVSIPVVAQRSLVGVLTVAVPIGAEAAEDLKAATLSDIILFSGAGVVASTFKSAGLADLLPELTERDSREVLHKTVIDGEHYLALAGALAGDSGNDSGYVLLYSYEESLRGLKATQQALWLVSLAGVLFSTAAVWFVVGRASFPLRQLRDNAEAIGRGDFTRRADMRTGDETGQLAAAFNSMTEKLETSRNDLEKAMETLKTTQAQLIQREKLSAVGEFVAGVAHELNNPLTAVIGFAELLQSSGVDERQRTSLGYITKSAQRCQKIVQGLLSFARQHQPERVPSDLNEVLEGIVDLIGYEFQRSDIEIRREFAPNLGKIAVDPHQLQQVFANILTNARHAIEGTRQPGWVRIATERTPSAVRIYLHDSGPGIPKEVAPKIFDPFFTTKGVGKGTGLGLSLSYGIIKEHGGVITVENRPGSGACFCIELPAGREESGLPRAAQALALADEKPAEQPAGKKILVVDDEDWILEFVGRVLRAESYSVETAVDGEKALAAISQSDYDMILCDLRMPGLTGVQLHEQVECERPEIARRFLFMTGDVVSESWKDFIGDERRCMTKPFSVHDLRQTVARFLKENGKSAAQEDMVAQA